MEAPRRRPLGRGEGAHAPAAPGVGPVAELGIEALTRPAPAPRGGHDVHVDVGEVRLGLADQAEQEAGRHAVGLLHPHARRPELLEEEPVHDQADGMTEPLVHHGPGPGVVAPLQAAAHEVRRVVHGPGGAGHSPDGRDRAA